MISHFRERYSGRASPSLDLHIPRQALTAQDPPPPLHHPPSDLLPATLPLPPIKKTMAFASSALSAKAVAVSRPKPAQRTACVPKVRPPLVCCWLSATATAVGPHAVTNCHCLSQAQAAAVKKMHKVTLKMPGNRTEVVQVRLFLGFMLHASPGAVQPLVHHPPPILRAAP